MECTGGFREYTHPHNAGAVDRKGDGKARADGTPSEQ